METISISKFKATCLAVLERVRKTGEPIQVTKFGKPVAAIVPADTGRRERKLGALKGELGMTLDLNPEEGGWDGGDEETIREWDELNSQPYGWDPSRATKTK